MRVAALLACVGAVACTSADPSGGGASGPADALIEFDTAAISLSPPKVDSGTKPLPDTAVPPAADVALRCTGTATPCTLIPRSSCATNLGCRREKDCSGYPGSCYAQFDSYSCSRIKGCYWSTSSKSCSGSATPCELYSEEYSCTLQRNCTFSDECTGTPLSCASMTAENCLNQAGCRLE
jgi:hypothetical protein